MVFPGGYFLSQKGCNNVDNHPSFTYGLGKEDIRGDILVM